MGHACTIYLWQCRTGYSAGSRPHQCRFFSLQTVRRYRKSSPATASRILQCLEPPAVRPACPDYRQPRRRCDYGYGWNAARHSVQLTPPVLSISLGLQEFRKPSNQTKSIRKIQPAVGLSFTGQPGWMPASQLISAPSCIASPWGSLESGPRSVLQPRAGCTEETQNEREKPAAGCFFSRNDA